MDKVIIRKQDEDYKVVEVEKLDLKFLQKSVGGYIELFRWSEDLCNRNIDLWINEEGKLIEGLKTTFVVRSKDTGEVVDIIKGDVLFTSTDGEGETIGLNDVQIQYIKSKLSTAAVLSDGSVAHVIDI